MYSRLFGNKNSTAPIAKLMDINPLLTYLLSFIDLASVPAASVVNKKWHSILQEKSHAILKMRIIPSLATLYAADKSLDVYLKLSVEDRLKTLLPTEEIPFMHQTSILNKIQNQSVVFQKQLILNALRRIKKNKLSLDKNEYILPTTPVSISPDETIVTIAEEKSTPHFDNETILSFNETIADILLLYKNLENLILPKPSSSRDFGYQLERLTSNDKKKLAKPIKKLLVSQLRAAYLNLSFSVASTSSQLTRALPHTNDPITEITLQTDAQIERGKIKARNFRILMLVVSAIITISALLELLLLPEEDRDTILSFTTLGLCLFGICIKDPILKYLDNHQDLHRTAGNRYGTFLNQSQTERAQRRADVSALISSSTPLSDASSSVAFAPSQARS